MLLRPLSDTLPSESPKQSPGELDIGSIPLRKVGVPDGLSYGQRSSVIDEEKRCSPEEDKGDDEDLSFYLDNIPKTFSGSISDLLRRYSSSSELSNVSEPQRPYIKLPGSKDGGEGYRTRYYDMIRIPPPPLVEFGIRFPPDELSDEDERDGIDLSDLSRSLEPLFGTFGWRGSDRVDSIDSQDPFIPSELLDREVEEEEERDSIDLSSMCERMSTLSDFFASFKKNKNGDKSSQRGNRGNTNDCQGPLVPPGLCREDSSSSSSRISPCSSLLSEPEPIFNPKPALNNERYTKKQLSHFGDFLHAPFSLSNATTPSPVMNDLGPLDTEAHVDCNCNRCRLLDYALTRDFDEIHPFALVNPKYVKNLDDEGNYIY